MGEKMTNKKAQIAMNNRKRGKRTEKKISEILEGLRIGILGGADILTDIFAVEVKSRKRLAFSGWWTQAQKNAQKLKKEPLLVVHEYNKKKYFAIIELNLFKKILLGHIFKESIFKDNQLIMNKQTQSKKIRSKRESKK